MEHPRIRLSGWSTSSFSVQKRAPTAGGCEGVSGCPGWMPAVLPGSSGTADGCRVSLRRALGSFVALLW